MIAELQLKALTVSLQRPGKEEMLPGTSKSYLSFPGPHAQTHLTCSSFWPLHAPTARGHPLQAGWLASHTLNSRVNHPSTQGYPGIRGRTKSPSALHWDSIWAYLNYLGLSVNYLFLVSNIKTRPKMSNIFKTFKHNLVSKLWNYS